MREKQRRANRWAKKQYWRYVDAGKAIRREENEVNDGKARRKKEDNILIFP